MKRRNPFNDHEPLRKCHFSEKENLERDQDEKKKIEEKTMKKLFSGSQHCSSAENTLQNAHLASFENRCLRAVRSKEEGQNTSNIFNFQKSVGEKQNNNWFATRTSQCFSTSLKDLPQDSNSFLQNNLIESQESNQPTIMSFFKPQNDYKHSENMAIHQTQGVKTSGMGMDFDISPATDHTPQSWLNVAHPMERVSQLQAELLESCNQVEAKCREPEFPSDIEKVRESQMKIWKELVDRLRNNGNLNKKVIMFEPENRCGICFRVPVPLSQRGCFNCFRPICVDCHYSCHICEKGFCQLCSVTLLDAEFTNSVCMNCHSMCD